MRRVLFGVGLLGLTAAVAGVRTPADAACCYFAAKDRDVLQPAQKAFVTWDPVENVESFTVQPRFAGSAKDFGMVIPTPARPKLDEMPRDFFRELAVFTILEPMDVEKYKRFLLPRGGSSGRVRWCPREGEEVYRQGAGGRGGRVARLQGHHRRSGRRTCTRG